MSAGNQLAIYLPFILAVLLVGAALAGSRMSPSRRAGFQRYLLFPLAILLMAVMLARFGYERDWLLFGTWALVCVFACAGLYRRFWPNTPKGAA